MAHIKPAEFSTQAIPVGRLMEIVGSLGLPVAVPVPWSGRMAGRGVGPGVVDAGVNAAYGVEGALWADLARGRAG